METSMATGAPEVVLDDVVEAAERLRRHFPPSPLRHLPGTGDLRVKTESLLPTGSFKIRGALHAVMKISETLKPRGVVTLSSGNHGCAVAHAATWAGIAAVIVVPETTPEVKQEALRKTGAEVVLTEPQVLEDRTAEIGRRLGFPEIGCDMPEVIAGQGTVGLELASQLPEADVVYVPVSTGSLLAGTAIALKGLGVAGRVVGVEPELAADGAESFARGELTVWPVARTYQTIADGLRMPSLGSHAWPLIRSLVDDVETVSERQIEQAVRMLAEAGVVAEPSGAVATAAMLRADRGPSDQSTVAVMSGGNVAPDWHRSICAQRKVSHHCR